ncbi:sigma-70 family RNA polymerase sigma factor [Chitinophaga lutea]
MRDYQQELFPYAYNILGAAEDARDAIQDVLAKYYAGPREGIENEKAYLVKSVINHAINMKTRKKKTLQAEVWLPEPVATESADGNMHLRDILSYSLLVLLEKLNAKERAVFILKESFDYGHDEIATILSTTEENSRKLLSRAKGKLFKPAQAPPVRTETVNNLLTNYIDAIRNRNLEKLEDLLAEDIAYYADGGPHLRVLARFCSGSHDVAELIDRVFKLYLRNTEIRPGIVNHQPAFLYYAKDRLVTCQILTLDAAGEKILQISNVVDPEKLKHLV